MHFKKNLSITNDKSANPIDMTLESDHNYFAQFQFSSNAGL